MEERDFSFLQLALRLEVAPPRYWVGVCVQPDFSAASPESNPSACVGIAPTS